MSLCFSKEKQKNKTNKVYSMLDGKYYGEKAGKEGGEHGGAGVTTLNMMARKAVYPLAVFFSRYDLLG